MRIFCTEHFSRLPSARSVPAGGGGGLLEDTFYVDGFVTFSPERQSPLA